MPTSTAATAATGGTLATAGGGGQAPGVSGMGAILPPGVSLSQAQIGRMVKQIGSADWSKWQWVRYTFWDYVRVPNTGALNTALSFFTVALGGADVFSGIQKTLEWTNMNQPGQFGQMYFVIQQIKTHLQLVPKVRQTATTAATTTYGADQFTVSQRLRSLIGNGVLDFIIGQKNYWHMQQPFRTCPPGFGLSEVIIPFDLTTSPNGNAYVAQSSDLADVYGVSPPQLIEPAQVFTASITFPDQTYNLSACLDANGQAANVEAGVILDGYLFRPVQ
jgi:hypothetical protein